MQPEDLLSKKLPPADSSFFFFFLLSFFLLPFITFSQPSNILLERTITLEYERLASPKNIAFHFSVKPFLYSELKQWLNVDSVEGTKGLTGKLKKMLSEKDSAQKPEDVSVKYIEVFPLFYLHSGYEVSDSARTSIAGTAIGGGLRAALGEKLFINADFLSANSAYPLFINQYIDSMKVIPGEGYAFPTKLGHHYKNSSGYISYSPSGMFNFQLGHGKNFFGDGYRSLLLSDVSNNYSYFKINTTIWKIKYVNLFTLFRDVRGDGRDYRNFKNKYGTFHYLSWNLAKWFNLGLFESVIWQEKDTLNHRGFEVNYLNPVIFYRPVEYSLGSADNSLMGFNFKFKITGKIQLYSQLILDEFLLSEVRANNGWWANKYGGQLGLKYFDAFGMKGLLLQAELNEVRPFTYSHGSSLQNYAHFNQPLAHPLGANFSEVLGLLHYNKRNFSITLKSVVSKYGADSAGVNYGGDVYKSYGSFYQTYGNKTGQGIANYLMANEINLSYLLVPKMNLRMEAGGLYRIKYTQNSTNNTVYFWLGLRTSLYNIYRDFM